MRTLRKWNEGRRHEQWCPQNASDALRSVFSFVGTVGGRFGTENGSWAILERFFGAQVRWHHRKVCTRNYPDGRGAAVYGFGPAPWRSCKSLPCCIRGAVSIVT